jgi:hypothetical protein
MGDCSVTIDPTSWSGQVSAGTAGAVPVREVVMVVQASAGALREILVVLALGIAGLLLAMLAAFTPWYGPTTTPSRPEIVEMHAPAKPPPGQPLPGTVAG